MNELIILHESKPSRILQNVLDEKIPLVISYLSAGRWHWVRVVVSSLNEDAFSVRISPQRKSHPIDICVNDSVGISIKHGYGSGYDKFVFDSTVIAIDCSAETGGLVTMSLSIPEEIEVVQRRSFSRVVVPKSLEVDVEFWHRDFENGGLVLPQNRCSRHGRLVDISASGLQIAFDAEQGPDFKKGESVGLRFMPAPLQTPLMFNAQVKTIAPTANSKSTCIGLQIVGLEASAEGRLILQRLCNIVDEYQKLSRS